MKRISFKQKVTALLDKKGLTELKAELGLVKPAQRVSLTRWQKKIIEKRLQAGQIVAMQLHASGVMMINPKYITVAKRFRYENPDLAAADRKKYLEAHPPKP